MSSDDAAVLAAIEAKYGKVKPEHVVAAAADPEHPWHDRFAWDDAVAGHNFRLYQARQVIREVRVTRYTETRVICAPAYVRDPNAAPREQGYVSILKIRSDEETAEAVLRMECGRAIAAMTRAREVSDYLGLSGSVDAIMQELETLAGTIRRAHEARAVAA